MLVVLTKEGHKAPKYLEFQRKISAELMQIRFSARQVERLCDSVRTEVDNIRQIERKIQDLVVHKGGMPRPDFIKKFPTNETSLRWIDREIARTTTTASSSRSTGRRSSSSSRSCSTCRSA